MKQKQDFRQLSFFQLTGKFVYNLGSVTTMVSGSDTLLTPSALSSKFCNLITKKFATINKCYVEIIDYARHLTQTM